MATETVHSPSENDMPTPVNIVAWVGVAFAILALVFYWILHQMLERLPESRTQLDELKTNAPALTRLLLVGAGAALMNFVSLILSLVGYLIPERSRTVPVLCGLVSLLMLLGVFSVVLVSLLLSH